MKPGWNTQKNFYRILAIGSMKSLIYPDLKIMLISIKHLKNMWDSLLKNIETSFYKFIIIDG